MTAATPETGPFRSVDPGRRLGLSGDNLGNYGNNTVKSTGLVLDGVCVASTRPLIAKVATSLSAAGAVTLAGTQVGDTVLSVSDLSGDSDVTSSFEATITIAGQIQQTVSTSGHAVFVVVQPRS